jgi:hypothetical protein
MLFFGQKHNTKRERNTKKITVVRAHRCGNEKTDTSKGESKAKVNHFRIGQNTFFKPLLGRCFEPMR